VVSGQSKGNISKFSSRGFDPSKPNITAPGEIVWSVCPSSDNRLCGEAGTSQATPYVSGAVALALERNPSLTPEDVINYLCKGAVRDDFTGEVPNNIWGCGKLNIPLFLSNVPPLSRKRSEHVANYSVQDVVLEKIEYKRIYVSSDFPFRVSSQSVYDTGWSLYHIFFVKNLPSNLKLEFADGFEKELKLSGDLSGFSCSCSSYSNQHLMSANSVLSWLSNIFLIALSVFLFFVFRSLFVSRT
jgi:subtilisin family serine protease